MILFKKGLKIAKNYVLFINPTLKTAYFGTKRFNRRISKTDKGTIYDCTFSQLKISIASLRELDFNVYKRNY